MQKLYLKIYVNGVFYSIYLPTVIIIYQSIFIHINNNVYMAH